MSYVVLARKYRPQQFTELVGQQHVATTLINAFKQNKLGQAYLLTGTRGVGKTSVARIFAKALRCEDPDAQPGGKRPGISCDKCPSCLEINSGSSLDVLEIDGASNNGVDNIREIREQVKFMPSRGRMKVYVVDEVHMLTNAAFNALLKTLEEPPPHVTFILATTEVQKIPETILSRCQRFDFRRVPQPLIQEHLTRIVELEGIKAEPVALRLVARKADGSMRDALSALDQCLAMGGKNLDVRVVSEALGLVSTSFLVKVLDHTFKRELVAAAELVQQAFQSGVEMKQLAIGLSETLRHALFVKLRAADSLVEISAEEKAEFESLVTNLSPETLQASFRAMNQSLEEILRSPLPRASLEMGLVRISGLGHLKSLEDLLAGLQSGVAVATGASAAQVAAPASRPLEKKSPEPTGLSPGASAASSLGPSASRPFPYSAKATMSAVTAPPSTDIAPSSAAVLSAPSGPLNFERLVSFVLQQKASLGALLEHAIAVNEENWATAAEVKIGFRKNHSFYQLQAQHKANFEQLEKHLAVFLGRKAKLVIETLAETASKSTGASSLVEKEKETFAKSAAEKKKKFLEHEIVRDTKEIFGAELLSFDIDKSKV